MPFTPAHAAILYPANWIKPAFISWTGLVIGSIAPDTEYFLWMDSAAFTSHSFTGIFFFDLPMVFLIAFAWHSFIAKGILSKIPFLKTDLRNCYDPYFSEYLKKNYLVFTFSAIAGICSHLVWDSFCHSKGFMVLKMPALLEYISIAGFKTRLCYVLWYLSTAIGMAGITLYIINLKSLFKKSSWRQIFSEYKFYMKVIFIAMFFAAGRIALGLNHNVPRHLVIITISSFLYGILIITYLERNKTISV